MPPTIKTTFNIYVLPTQYHQQHVFYSLGLLLTIYEKGPKKVWKSVRGKINYLIFFFFFNWKIFGIN